jgi:3-oxoacyl-[acyl-carrier protein] reductase
VSPARAPDLDLAGRAVVVVGAGGGLGRGIAEMVAAAGASVACADHDAAAAEACATAIGDLGGRALARPVDARSSAALAGLCADAAALGPVRGWVNAAGVMSYAKVVDLSEDDFDAVMAVNVKGVLLGSQAAARAMIEHGAGGSIVNVVSAILDAPQPRMAAYGASKAAASHLSRTLALEVGRHGVRVNLVAPGWTRTSMTEQPFRADDGSVDEAAVAATAEMQAQFTPLRRAARPDDTAAAALWLLSDASAFVTGQTIRPHGGVTTPW